MAISVTTKGTATTGGSTSATISLGSLTVTAGNTLIAVVGWDNSAIGTKSCTYNDGTDDYPMTLAIHQQNNASCLIYFLDNVSAASGSGSITFQYEIPDYGGITVYEVSGLESTGSLDKTVGASDRSTSFNSGDTATTSQADELVVGGVATEGGTSIASWTGTATDNIQTANDSGNGGVESATKTVSSTGTYNVAGTLAKDYWAAAVATFTQASDYGVQYLQSAYDNTETATHTFSSQNLGYARTGRHIIVAVHANNNETINSVTVGGQSATIVQQATYSDAADFYRVAGIAIVALDSGTSGDIVVTMSGSGNRCAVDVYKAWGLSSATPTDTGSDTGTTPSDTINVNANGFALSSFTNSGSTTIVWTGVTQNNAAEPDTGFVYASAHKVYDTAQTPLTVTVEPADQQDNTMVCASWAFDTGGGPTTAQPSLASVLATIATPTLLIAKSAFASATEALTSIIVNTPLALTSRNATATTASASVTISTETASTLISKSSIATTATANISVLANTATAVTSVVASSTATATLVSISVLTNTPTASISKSAVATSTLVSVSITSETPTLSKSYSRTALPSAAGITITVETPTAGQIVRVIASPSLALISVISNTPAVQYSKSSIATTTSASITITVETPVIVSGSSAIAQTAVAYINGILNTPTVSVSKNATATTTTVSVSVTLETPTASTSVLGISSTANANLVEVSVLPNSPTLKISVSSTAQNTTQYTTVLINTPTALVNRSGLASPSVSVVSIGANAPTVRVTRSQTATCSVADITIIISTPTASVRTGQITLQIVLVSRIEKQPIFKSRMEKYFTGNSKVETNLKYNSRMQKYFVRDSRFEKTVLKKSEILT